MSQIDIFNLDIRMIHPFYGSETSSSGNPRNKNRDLGLFYLDGTELKVLMVSNGLQFLEEARSRIFGQINYGFPIVKSDHLKRLLNRINEGKNLRQIRVAKKEFGSTAKRFVEEYALGRLEQEITSAQDYISLKQNMPQPFDYEHKPEKRRDAFEQQRKLTDRLEVYLKEAPQILGIPSNSSEVFREVRLDTKFSRCVLTLEEYQKLTNGDNSLITNLTISDFIVLAPSGEIYVVEVKTLMNPKQSSRVRYDARRHGRNQLGKASLFFQQNFGIYPTLIRATFHGPEENKRLGVTHYKFHGGRFHMIKTG